MPGRLLVMDATSSSPMSGDNNALASNANAPNRRKSGRAVKKPEMIYPGFNTPSGSEGKRKRAQQDEDLDEEDDASEGESQAGSEGEADEEELNQKRKRAPKAKKLPTKPAAKKPKIANGVLSKQLALRPASNAPKKPRKRKQPTKASVKAAAPASSESTDLYCKFQITKSEMLSLV